MIYKAEQLSGQTSGKLPYAMCAQNKLSNRAILGQLENVVKNIYPEGGTFAGMLGHMPFLLKDN